MEITQAQTILRRHGLVPQSITALKGSFDKDIFLVDNAYVLRPSQSDMSQELLRFQRVQNLSHVPKILFQGSIDLDQSYNYLIVSLLPGMDFIDAVADLSRGQQRKFGQSAALFLDSLHGLKATHYDIGHYLPLIPHFGGSWQDGHARYWDYLEQGLAGLPLNSNPIIKSALAYLRTHAAALAYQAGPVLLHNDFHPKNMVADQGEFSGVIDWECSQYGEADFDLCHLIHWCLYPPKAGVDFKPFLSALWEAKPHCVSVPDLSARLSIYQIEHEIIQMIWSGGKTDRLPKLQTWLEGGVDKLLAAL